MPARSRNPLLVLVLAGSLVPLAAAPAAAVAIPAPIFVTTLGDVVGNDGSCSLHEAIAAANENVASGAAEGECAAGVVTGSDTIVFLTAGTITMTASMPDITTDMAIDGGGSITIDADGVDTVLSTAAPAVVTLEGLTLTGGDGSAGGIGNYGTLTLSHVTLTGNHAADAGGGVLNATGSTLTIVDSTIAGNTTPSNGGGVYGAAGSTTSVTRSTIDANTALLGGGLYLAPTATATVLRSTISNNAGFDGAGARTYGTLNLSNSTVAQNAAQAGATGTGGISVMSGGTLNILSSTIALNTSDASPGVWIQDGGHWTMTNGLVVGNAQGDWSSTDPLTRAVNSLVGLTKAEVGQTLAGGLTDNGGPTRTIKLAQDAANLALNRGKATACAASPISAVDQRGVARPTLCDVGAFELDTTAPTISLRNPSYLRSLLPTDNRAWARVAWSGSDGTKGSGIVSYDVSRSVNGGAWATVSPAQPGNAHDQTLKPGTTYRFRIRARDRDGNTGAWKVGPSFTARLVNETSSAIRYVGSWYRKPMTGAVGGYSKTASKAGASATFTFTGRAIALVTSVGPTRGKAKIYLNGTYVATIDPVNAAGVPRVVYWTRAWTTSGTRTVKVVVVGTAGRPRVDIDAFLVMR